MIRRICLLLVLTAVLAQQDTNFMGKVTSFQLMAGQYDNITLPFTFQNYQSVEITQNVEGAPVCVTDEIDLLFVETDRIYRYTSLSYMDVVTEYEYLLNYTRLVDMVAFDNHIYLLYNDMLFVASLNVKLNATVTEVSGFLSSDSKKLIMGRNELYLITNDAIERVNKSELSPVTGYVHQPDFVSACFLNESILAVLDQTMGLTIFHIEGDMLTLLYTFAKDFFGGDVNFQDIIPDNGSLLVLDESMGVLSLTLVTNFEESSLKTVSKTSGCTFMKKYKQVVYLACDELHSLNTSDSYAESTYPPISFTIRNINLVSGRVMITGSNLVKIYNGKDEIDTYFNSPIKRIYLHGDTMLIGNNRGIEVSKFKISNPIITCGVSRNSNITGNVKLEVKVVAECNKVYFQDSHINSQAIEGAECLYHFPLSIDLWRGKQKSFMALKIAAGVIGAFVVLGIVFWSRLKREVLQLKRRLEEHNKQDGASEIALKAVKYNELVEDKDKGETTQSRKGQDSQDNYDVGN